MRVWQEDDPVDGPDAWLVWKMKRRVVAAWNSNNSTSKVDADNPCVFFFPTDEDRGDPNAEGWVKPKMYKRPKLDGKIAGRRVRARKQEWRKTSKRLQDESRFKRLPRDESGKASTGTFGKTSRTQYSQVGRPSPKRRWRK